MAIVKVSASKKSLMFIDDEGVVYITPVVFMQDLISDNPRSPVVLLSRMPLKAAPNRFKKSPLFDPNGTSKTQVKLVDKQEVTLTTDAFSATRIAEAKDVALFQDKKVW